MLEKFCYPQITQLNALYTATFHRGFILCSTTVQQCYSVITLQCYSTMHPDWQINISESDPQWSSKICLTIFRKNGDHSVDVMYFDSGTPIVKRLHTDKEKMEAKPSLILSAFEGQQILQSLMDGLNKKYTQPKPINPLEGKLEAMSYHLEDMRKLVFNEKS